jgi:uncharacterized protein YgbK (DUF1537 family)
MSYFPFMSINKVVPYFCEVLSQLNSYKHGCVATGNQPASTYEPQKELSEAPVSQSVSTVSASLSRNLLSDMNLLQYANISGGTFTFNITGASESSFCGSDVDAG